jgi:hypothetical protein
VGDRYDGFLPNLAKSLEKDDSFDIKVVRWLIENQEIYFSDEKFGNLYLGLFPS